MFLNIINNYLTLIRVPNLFTVISNILVGYFLVIAISDIDIYQLSYLILISIFLYIGGVVMNDLFDIKLDKLERPERPLPSNLIKKKNALIICIVSICTSLFISFFLMNHHTFLVTLFMIILIVIYNSKTKSTKWRSVTLGLIRCLNIFLGSSTSIFNLNYNMLPFIIILLSTFFYIFSISMLSRNESKQVNQIDTIRSSFIIVYVVLFSIFISILFGNGFFNAFAIVNFIIFAILVIYYHKRCIKKIDPFAIQWTVKNLIISIIILDSIFITGLAGIYYGLATLILVIPPILLSKKTRVT